MATTLIKLSKRHKPSVVAIWKAAFFSDPLFQHVFSGTKQPYAACLDALFGYAAEVRLQLKFPLIGTAHSSGRLVGAAGLTLPGEHPWPESLTRIYREYQEFVGEPAATQFAQIFQDMEPHRPTQPYYELGILGVLPEFHGQGFGGHLVAASIQLADSHSDAQGMYLETQSADNIRFYQRFGFYILEEVQVGSGKTHRMWAMFRPKTEGKREDGRPNPHSKT
jgi:GNAT superfamily N-acetyltransferase